MRKVGKVPTGVIGSKNIDGTLTGVNSLGDTDGGVFSVPSRLAFIAQDIQGLTTAPTVSVGIVGPNYDDLLTDTVLSDISATLDVQLESLKKSKALLPGTELFINIKVAATATSFILKVGVEVAED